MIALPKWIRVQAKELREIRLGQRRVTSDEARKQCLRLESATVFTGQNGSRSLNGRRKVTAS